MYIIVNTEDNRVCSEWNYLNRPEKFICWKTHSEIEAENSYRTNNVYIKRFSTKKLAKKFIKDFDQLDCYMIMPSNFFSKLFDYFMCMIKESYYLIFN